MLSEVGPRPLLPSTSLRVDLIIYTVGGFMLEGKSADFRETELQRLQTEEMLNGSMQI